MTEKKKGPIGCSDDFSFEVINKLQLMWRYFQKRAESDYEGERLTEIEMSELEFVAVCNRFQSNPGRTVKMTGRLTDGYCIEICDFYAIYNVLSETLCLAKKLYDAQN